MSSGWSRPTDVYLGQSVALAGRDGVAAVVVRFPPTLPLLRALTQLQEQASELLKSGTRLRVRLSPALCPLVRFEVPEGIRSWKELETIASAHAANAMDVPAPQLVVGIDPLQPGCVAAMPRVVQEVIKGWCRQGKFKLVSLAPLWSEASQCAAVRGAAVTGFVLREPDGTTGVGSDSEPDNAHAELTFQLDAMETLNAAAPAFLRSHWQVA